MHLPAWKSDRPWTKAIVVNYDTSVSGTAFVLPGIDPFLTNPKDKSQKGKLIMKIFLRTNISWFSLKDMIGQMLIGKICEYELI
jgi:hypothetical protein